VVALLKDRAQSVNQLAEAAMLFYGEHPPPAALLAQHLDAKTLPALRTLKARLAGIEWSRAAIGAAIAAVLKEHGMKMPQLAMPLRVLATGSAQTPAVDAVLELLGREKVLARLSHHLDRD
jgi:glutamyl-tRNA synthetase